MDPHLTVVKVWDKDYIPTAEEAYHEARINGYIFPQLNNSDELERIASHPPNINYNRYIYYSKLSMEELKNEFPVLVDLLKNKLSYEDLFYYATRGWIPEYDNLNYKIDRWNKYNDLSNVGKSLINMLYNNQDRYINNFPDSNEKKLEQLIFDYDTYMDSESTLFNIADRSGIILNNNNNIIDEFYDMIVKMI